MLNLQLPDGGSQFDAAVFTQSGDFERAALSMTFETGEDGEINLPSGQVVRLIQNAYNDNDSDGRPAWFAAGYLTTEDEGDKTGPTVKVTWASLGNTEAENDADWDTPISVRHYAVGELL